MTNEALKLVQSKQDNSPIISMYIMDISIYIMKFIIIFKIILHNITFVKILIVRPKPMFFFSNSSSRCTN
jgi:hypothetical protein